LVGTDVEAASSVSRVLDEILGGLEGLRVRLFADGYSLSEIDEEALDSLAFAARMAMEAGLPALPEIDRLLFDVFYAKQPFGFGHELGDSICRSGSLERVDPDFLGPKAFDDGPLSDPEPGS
jgi:hypothetical protein